MFYTLGTHGIFHTQFGLIWLTPWPDEKDLFSKLLIWNNSKFSYEKKTFFLCKINRKIVLSQSSTTMGKLHNKFGLIWTSFWPDEKDLFLKLLILNNSKFPYEKLTFFLGKLYQRFFLFYTLGTHVILHNQFGLIWLSPWPDEKDLFLRLLIWNNSKFSYEKLIYFLGKLCRKIDLSQSPTTMGKLHNKFGLIRTTFWPDEKDLFLNLLIWNNSKFPYEKLTFFLGKLYQRFFFVLHSRYPCYTPNPVWFDLTNSLTRWKRTIFKITYLK